MECKPAEKQIVESVKPCDHPELYHSICNMCYKLLGRNEINYGEFEYREYALLGKGRGLLIRSDHAPEYIRREVDYLFKKRKLVLVLDLDNTLIHSQDLGLDRSRRG